jgi:GNAT superfamily N-acetyltransferase
MLDHLVDDVDGVDHVALVLLVTTDDGTELPLGLARIVRYPHDPAAADVAVTVVDDWHGRGVATALLEVLMRRRPPGVERIVTVVQADNRASVAMLARLGPVEVGDPESGTRRVVVDLSGATSRKDPGDRAGAAQESAASRSNPGRVCVDSRSRAASRAADGG